MNEEVKQNKGEVEIKKAIKSLWYWRKGGDSFTCMLYDLAHNSSEAKREQLFKGFPYERIVYRMWKKSHIPESQWFEERGLRFEDGK